jgi:hypothetical protein
MVGKTLESFFVHDKIALGRILKMVHKKHKYLLLQQFQIEAQQMFCTQLFLANLNCLARIYIFVSQQEQTNPKEGLLKYVMNILQPSFDQLVTCWKNVLIEYGLLLQRHVSNENGGDGMDSSSELLQNYAKYFPAILQAFVYSTSVITNQEDVLPFVLATCLFALTSVDSRLTLEEEEEQHHFILPIVQILPLLFEKTKSYDGPFEYDEILETLRATSLKVQGPVRLETLKALEAILHDRNKKNDGVVVFTPLVTSVAALTALDILKESFSTTRVKASLRLRSLRGHFKLLTGQEPLSEMIDLLHIASTGIVFVHTMEGDFSGKKKLQIAIQSLEETCRFLYKRKELQEALLMLSRAIIESFIAYSIQDTSSLEMNKQIFEKFLLSMIQWVRQEITTSNTTNTSNINTNNTESLEFVLHLVPTFIVVSNLALMNCCMAKLYEAFHHVLSTILIQEIIQETTNDPQKQIVLLEGVYEICKKLKDGEDPNLGKYCTLIGPYLVQIVTCSSKQQLEQKDIAVIDRAEKLLRLICNAMDETFGAAFVRVLLPSISTALLNHHMNDSTVHQDEDTNSIASPMSSILARLLLSFAQTRAAAFKEVVLSMPMESRSILETTLRQALSEGENKMNSNTTIGQLQSMGSQKLDLSRYA